MLWNLSHAVRWTNELMTSLVNNAMVYFSVRTYKECRNNLINEKVFALYVAQNSSRHQLDSTISIQFKPNRHITCQTTLTLFTISDDYMPFARTKFSRHVSGKLLQWVYWIQYWINCESALQGLYSIMEHWERTICSWNWNNSIL